MSEPLIGKFSNNLASSSCCGKINITDQKYDRFWSKNMDNQDSIEFMVSVAVKAKSVKEAIEKISEGDVISVNPRRPANITHPVQGAAPLIRPSVIPQSSR